MERPPHLRERAAGLSFCLEDEVLAELVAGTLDPSERARAQRHLDACSTCFSCLIDETHRARARRDAAAATPRTAPKRRRAPLALVPLAGLAVMIAITGWVRAGTVPELCDDPRGRIERAWSAAQRAAFAKDDAGAAWVVQIDRYADAWAQAAEQACSAAAPGTPMSPELHAQLHCLADQRARLESFADAARAPVGERLFDGALALPPVGVCPTDRDDDDDARALRSELARQEGIAFAGDPAAALAALAQLELRARELGARGLEAELLLAHGRIQAAAGELVLAGGTLLAASNAAEAGRADAVLADSLLALVDVTRARGELVRAREYADRTAAAIERIGVSDRGKDGALALARARIDLVAGNLAAAQTGMRDALTVLPQHDPSWILALEGLATVQAARGDHRGARTNAARVFEARRAALGEHHPRVALARLELAREQHASGEHEAAMLELDAALPIASRSTGPRSTTVARMLDLRGALLRELGRPAEAIEHFRRARRILVEQLGEHHELVAATERNEALALALGG